MIRVLTGENSFEIDRATRKLAAQFDGVVERIDGSQLEVRQLPDLLMGGTLFAERRMVIIKNLSENKIIWPVLGDWLLRLSEDIQLILIEPKPDKRTKAYKDLHKTAEMQDYPAWTERDTSTAIQWVMQEATRQSFTMNIQLAQLLVARVGLDQWRLETALQKLAVLETIDVQVIEQYIASQPTESVFNLFEAALRGHTGAVGQMIETLQLTEDPYRLFGLLSGQAFQFAILAVADGTNTEVAKAIGAHPYALGKLAPLARNAGQSGAKNVIAAFLEADSDLKSSVGEPWLLIERALMKMAMTTH